MKSTMSLMSGQYCKIFESKILCNILATSQHKHKLMYA